MIHKTLFSAALLPAAILTLSMVPAVNAQEIVETSSITACCAMFDIDSNAAGLTAKQRAVIVQHSLDKALLEALDRSPGAVRVEVIQRNPTVTLDHHVIVTADDNSAKRNRLSSMELAEKWADSIRACLADSAAIDKYLVMLTGRYPVKAVALGVMNRDDIAVLTTGAMLPIDLVTPISSATARVGDRIEAVVSHDVPLRTSFATYLPAGTVVIGQVENALDYLPTKFAGKDAFTVNFFEMRTPDGKRIPIDAHVYGAINSWRQIAIKPVAAQCCGNGNTIKDMNLVGVKVVPCKGYIVGSWKGVPMETPSWDDNLYPRLVFKRQTTPIVVPAGEQMMLQFSATTVIAVAGRSF